MWFSADFDKRNFITLFMKKKYIISEKKKSNYVNFCKILSVLTEKLENKNSDAFKLNETYVL